jgi:hypothetical protein
MFLAPYLPAPSCACHDITSSRDHALRDRFVLQGARRLPERGTIRMKFGG